MSDGVPPRVLTIAGSDSGGGAGIQADLKTITCLGGYGMSALTALTAQNTLGVFGVHPVPPEFVVQQIRVCLEDIGADAAKTGMLATPEIVGAVAEALADFPSVALVVDPVMVAKSGDRLLAPEAEAALVERLLPLAAVVTPNLPEAQALTGMNIENMAAMRQAAEAILRMGPRCVLVKGGHLKAGAADDLFYDGETMRELSAPRIETRNTHGTGCTFSAALATELARGLEPLDAAGRAKTFITEAIRHGLDLGGGHGPTDPVAGAAAVGRGMLSDSRLTRGGGDALRPRSGQAGKEGSFS